MVYDPYRYHQLSRVSGEADKARIWSSAAKFELMLYNQSENKVCEMIVFLW